MVYDNIHSATRQIAYHYSLTVLPIIIYAGLFRSNSFQHGRQSGFNRSSVL